MGTKTLLLLTGAWLAGSPAWADEPPVFKPPLQRQLESQILPVVRIHDAEFTEALVYLQMQALAASQNAVRVPFVVQLPVDFQPRYELTLDLKAVPFWEALGQLGRQAGVECSIVKGAVTIRPASAAAKATVRTLLPAPAAPDPRQERAGRLGETAKPFGAGNKNHYNTAGVIQPERSGYIPHRSLSGWSIESDPGNRMSVNCVNITKCKAHPGGSPCPCGCTVCGCLPSKVEKYAGPRRTRLQR
jgi:hypothetical protein